MRAGRCLRVILDAEDRQIAVAETLDTSIIEVDVGDFQLRGSLYGAVVTLDRETVVLRCDQHSAGLDLFYGVIPTAMAV